VNNEDRLKIALTYSWEWFKYHADQRLKAFHFFLIIVGTLSVAFTQSVAQNLRPAAIGVGVLGMLVSVAFWILDIRNEELVYCGRVALDELEEALGVHVRRDDRTRRHLKTAIGDRWFSGRIYPWIQQNPVRREHIFTHRRWLRRIETTFGIAFLTATVWASAWFRTG